MQMDSKDFTRILNKFLLEKGVSFTNLSFPDYFEANKGLLDTKYRVAFNIICVNPPYWQYLKGVIDSARKYFLAGHQVDIFIWSDIISPDNPNKDAFLANFPTATDLLNLSLQGESINQYVSREVVNQSIEDVANLGVTVFPIEPIEWPRPTLMRYHTYLQQEEILQEYDYIFHCDADMLFVSMVGDEVLGKGLTAVQQPMYALDKIYIPPYEPNPRSTAYIPRPGRIINENGKTRFEPLYYAGGFQGGTSKSFIEAMKVMRVNIDQDDFRENYTAIWNDESHWQRYLFDNPPSVVLDPGYTYPDTLKDEYFVSKIWGTDYNPKILTLTKRFSLTREGGDAVQKYIK